MNFARAIAVAACLMMPAGSAAAQSAGESFSRCATQKPMADVRTSPRWTDWAIDLSNTRFQPRGPVIAGGMVYVNSGYGSHAARGGNVLLAYGID